MNRQKYNVKYDAVLKNSFSNEILKCNITNEREIDGHIYWEVKLSNRPGSKYLYNKEAWSLQKSR
jgi:hypothetical protein